jgi:hypothetical protein
MGSVTINAAKIKILKYFGFSYTLYKNKGKYISKLELLTINDRLSPIIIDKVLLSK